MSTTQIPSEPLYPSRAEIDWHVAKGRQLRAEATAEGFRVARAWLRDRRGAIGMPAFRRRRPVVSGDAAESLRTPLTAIRSAAEILHDHPEMAPQERARFVRILLKEEQRLERLVAALAPVGAGHLAR